MSRAAFPDEQYEIEHVLADGDLVCVHCTITGTHEGEYLGLEPTERSFEETMFVLVRMENGRIAEAWGLADLYGTAMQLGLVPSVEVLFAGEDPTPSA